MTYEPTVWKSKDRITAVLLNKMEQGIANASGVMLVTITESDSYVSDKSYEEIAAAIESGVIPVFEADGQYFYLAQYDPEYGLMACSNPEIGTLGISVTSLYFSKEGEIVFQSNITNSAGLVLDVVKHGQQPATLSAQAGVIYQALLNGIRVVVRYSEWIDEHAQEMTTYPIYECGHNDETGEYYFTITNYAQEDTVFSAQSADDYPTESES